MIVSRQLIDKLVQLCEREPRHGEWREFCQREGVGYDTLMYWRRKLHLRLRNYKSVNPEEASHRSIGTI